MFTGLIEGIGKVKAVRCLQDNMSLTIAPLFEISDCYVGESIAVNGVCLTVTGFSAGVFNMDVSEETLSCSTLSLLKQGDEVNLERALRFSDRLGGHLVSGHVDGIGNILIKKPQQRFWFVRIGVDEKISRHFIKKGSVSVDGVSLTITNCDKNFIDLNIIPQTWMATTILHKKVGDQVNIETDLIGKYVENFFSKGTSKQQKKVSSAIDLEMLTTYGFGD